MISGVFSMLLRDDQVTPPPLSTLTHAQMGGALGDGQQLSQGQTTRQKVCNELT